MSGQCDPIVQTPLEVAIGSILIVGIVGSYAAQWAKILKARSARGLSEIMLFLGAFTSMTTVVNAVILQYDRMRCCSQWTVSQCADSLISFIQLAAQWGSYQMSFSLFMCFNPHRKPLNVKRYKLSWILYGLYYFAILLFGMVTGMLLQFLHPDSEPTVAFGQATGILTTVTTFVQWLPQLIETGRRRSVGALSIPMLCIQMPGSMVFFLYMAFAQHADVTTWLPTAAAALQQLILLTMCIIFCARERVRKRRLARAGQAVPVDGVEAGDAVDNEKENEHVPLIAPSDLSINRDGHLTPDMSSSHL